MTPREVAAGELADKRFRCLEGCGFCCTFQPEVSRLELARLRARFQPRPIAVAVGEGRTYLQLQNKCGACTLLSRKACTAYDLRPAHCRYFPFHVHFGETPEAYVNYTCRGVEAFPGGTLAADFEASVFGAASEDEWREHERQARETYAEFRRRARRSGAWGEVGAALGAASALGAQLLCGEGIEEACRRGGEPATAAAALQDALAPFHEEEVTKRPFLLAPDLRWLTFAPDPAQPGALVVLEMDEAGDLHPTGQRVDGLDRWQDLPADVAAALLAYLASLTRRGAFAGGVYALVDDSDYATGVEQATWLRLAEIATDLVLRARILTRMGAPPDRVADEVARFYDSTFLDAPSIGGWL